MPPAPQGSYPAIIRDSPERRARAEGQWRRLLATSGAPQTPPDLYPIIHTPRSLLGLSGGIKVSGGNSDEIALREAVRNFIDRWQELLGASPAMISLQKVTRSGQLLHLTYVQSNYPFPLVGNYGVMEIAITMDGRMVELDDRLIPVVELPSRPALTADGAAAALLGRTITCHDAAGREQRVDVTSPDQLSARRLVVLALERADSIQVHLAWEISIKGSAQLTVYIDAMGGAELMSAPELELR